MSARWRRRLDRAALRLVPQEWRDAVARDLADERLRSIALEAAAIGARLHLARAIDRLTPAGRRRTVRRRQWIMRDFGRDLRLAARGAVRRPGYSLAVIATLAIGIGANTAIYSVFNWILFRPLPAVAQPDRLVTIRFQLQRSPGARLFVSYRDYADLRDGMAALSGLAGSAAMSINLAAGQQDPERLQSELVTTNYFDVLGAAPAPGRGFTAAEEHPGTGAPAAIISRDLWKRLFGGDAAALGRTLMLNGHAFTVVGIAPAGFQGRSLVDPTDIWLPIGAHNQVAPNQGADLLTNRRRTLFIDAIGRLQPGATVAQAQAQATAVTAAVADFAGRSSPSRRIGLGPVVYAGLGYDTFAKERLATIFRLLMGSVGLVLLLACANAANLLLARAVGRRREIAVCQAIGASRFQIVRQQLAEGIVLSLAAGAAGLVLAIWMTSLFDGMRILTFLPSVKGVGIDWRVGVFTLATALATGMLFALAPALVSSRFDLQSSLKDGLTTSRHGRRWLRGSLAALQVAVSILLLVGAGLFISTLNNIRALKLGMEVGGVVSFAADPSRQGYSDERSRQYFRDLLARLRAVPGVQSAAYSWTTPFLPDRSEIGFALRDARDKPFDAAKTDISPGYFATLKIPILAGRDFSEAECEQDNDRHGVVIISAGMAKSVFPRGGAVGSTLVLDYPKGKEVEIVGVVGDVRGRPVTSDPEWWAYTPSSGGAWGRVHVRAAAPFGPTAAAIRDAARAIDPLLPPYDIEPFGASIDRLLSEQRLLARLSAIFAAVAALLAAIGIYGMMAGAVSERKREFGIRLALGARASNVLALVLRGALVLCGGGMAAGLAGALALRRTVESRLYGVTGADPATIAAACATLLALAIAASLVPAVRASRVDPVRSLRSD